MYLLLLVVAIVVLLVVVWDLKARQALKKFRKVEANDYKADVIPRLAADPVWQFFDFFYQTAFKRESEFSRTQRFLKNNDDLKIRSALFFGRNLLVSWNPKVVKQILIKDVNNWRKLTNLITSFDELVGESIFAVHGEQWKNQKQILSASFHHEYIRNLTPVFCAVADKLCNKLEALATSTKEFEPYYWLSKMTLDAIGQAGFGYNFNALESDAGKEYLAYETIIHNFTNPLRIFGFYEKLPLKDNREMKEAMKVFSDWSNFMIEKKQSASERKVDLLDLMVESNEETSLTRKELLNNIFLFFLAGHETTSGTLTAVLYFLSRHPDVQDKVRDEISQVFSGNEPTYDGIKSLQYMNQVINEASRLLGPLAAISRIAKEDCTVEGYFVPKGTLLVLSILNIHRDKDIWGEDVLEFDPDRWTPERVKQRPNNSFLPFGAGSRICLGNNFANLEMRITLVKLLEKFKFTIATPELIVPRAITIRPQPGFMLGIEKL